MKNFLLLILASLVSLASFSQTPITITTADLPQAGDHFILANDTAPAISLGSPGSTPQVWDFSQVWNHYYKAAVYDSTVNTPFAGEFPQSNISTYGPSHFFGALFGGAPLSSGNNGYMFWRNDTSGLEIIGWKAVDGPFAYDPIYENPTELLIGTPASFGTNFTDTARWQLMMGDVPTDVDTIYVSTRFKTLSCDAWGSMNTPFGNFPDIIRIHETVVEVDSALASLNNIILPQYSFEIYRDTSNNYMYMANGVGYPLAIVHADKNNNIKDIEYLIDTTCSVYSEIYGDVFDNTGSIVSGGYVYLYQYIDNLTPLDLVDSVPIDSFGYYSFFNVMAGQYLLLAEADSSACPNCIPTYFGDASLWEDAPWIYSLCIGFINGNITLTELAPLTGSGSCMGNIQFGLGKTAGDPIPGIDIALEQIPGGIKAHSTTDPLGNFTFGNIPNGTYRLLVDYPGLPMDSTYQFTISSSVSSFINLNFTVDTTAGSGGIFVGYPLSSGGLIIKNTGFRVFPNPATSQITIESKAELNDATLIISDLMGKEILEMNNISEKSFSVKTGNIPSGFYFWKLVEKNNVVGTGKISFVK